MPVKKGQRLEGAGRPKGSLNKVTERIKDSFAQLVDNNRDNIEKWLEEVAKTDPRAALELINKFGQYFVPKKTSNDIQINGDPIKIIMPKKPKDKDDEAIQE